MRLPSECYQMKQAIETHKRICPASPAAIDRAGSMGVRDYSGRERLPERRRRRSLDPGQLEQHAAVPPGVAVRRRRPGAPLRDGTGRKPESTDGRREDSGRGVRELQAR